jgi:hypothetical protein
MSPVFSKLLRRTHLYLALFLTPWVLMYTFSTFAMNHKERQAKPPKWEVTSDSIYPGTFPDGAKHQLIAQQILTSLDLDGAHQSSQREGGKIIIQRLAAVQPIRLTFEPTTKRLVIEKQVQTPTVFLERMHRRRGFQHPYTLEDTWAFTVDLFIAGVIFWALSGLWMWWELKVTRTTGLFAVVGGLALFAFFLVVL